MNVKQHIYAGAVVITTILVATWLHTGSFIMAAFIVATILAQVIALDSFLFYRQYRRVKWNSSPWGRHIMRLCLMLGITFEAVVIVNLLRMADAHPIKAIAVLTLIMYSAIAAEVHNRRFLEKRAQEQRKKVSND